MLSATLGFAAYLARRAPTIPTLLWRTQRDIFRSAAWLRPSHPSAICLHLGTFRSPAEWIWATQGIRVLKQALQRNALDPRLLIYGTASVDRMRSILTIWQGRVTFASSKPLLVAEGGNRLRDDLSQVPAWSVPKSELRVENSRTFERAALRAAEGLALSA